MESSKQIGEILPGNWFIGGGEGYKGIKAIVQKAGLGKQWANNDFLVNRGATYL